MRLILTVTKNEITAQHTEFLYLRTLNIKCKFHEINCECKFIHFPIVIKKEYPPLNAIQDTVCASKLIQLFVFYFKLHNYMKSRSNCKTPVRKLIWNVRWPRELNTLLHLQKTHANRKSTSKSRKLLHQFDSRCCKCSQHNQIKNCISFFVWLCCEYLGCVSWFICVVSICNMYVVKLTKLFS